MSFKRLLVLNTDVSGMNRFLFQSLRDSGWELAIFDIPLPRAAVLWAYIATFHPNPWRWKKQASQKLGSYLKSPEIFRRRTLYCEKLLKRHWRERDLILQIAGLFAPALTPERLPGPYAVFLSFTTKLAEREYPAWAVFASAAAAEAWHERETYLYRQAKYLLTTNAHAKDSLITDYQVKPAAITVIGYGVNLEKIIPPSQPPAAPKILFIGYDFARKGGPTLLDAFALVRAEIPAAELIIVGPKPPETIPAGVNWLGPVKDRSTIVALLQSATLFVMPSVCEPFGLVLLEAMAYGLPCIGTLVDAMPEIIQEGETGYLIQPADVKTLAAKIIPVLADPQLRQRLSQAAILRVKETFTWSLVGKRITAALKP